MKLYIFKDGSKCSDRFYGFVHEAINLSLWDKVVLWLQGHVKERRE